MSTNMRTCLQHDSLASRGNRWRKWLSRTSYQGQPGSFSHQALQCWKEKWCNLGFEWLDQAVSRFILFVFLQKHISENWNVIETSLCKRSSAGPGMQPAGNMECCVVLECLCHYPDYWSFGKLKSCSVYLNSEKQELGNFYNKSNYCKWGAGQFKKCNSTFFVDGMQRMLCFAAKAVARYWKPNLFDVDKKGCRENAKTRVLRSFIHFRSGPFLGGVIIGHALFCSAFMCLLFKEDVKFYSKMD